MTMTLAKTGKRRVGIYIVHLFSTDMISISSVGKLGPGLAFHVPFFSVCSEQAPSSESEICRVSKL